MTDLKCSVTQCVSNQDNLCALYRIQVEGASAHSKDQTTCGSFQERKSAPTNATSPGSASEQTEVACEACDCEHNDAKVCHADYISVQGSGTDTRNDTLCGTFKPRR